MLYEILAIIFKKNKFMERFTSESKGTKGEAQNKEIENMSEQEYSEYVEAQLTEISWLLARDYNENNYGVSLDEILQDTRIKAWKAFRNPNSSFKGRAEFRNWIMRIANNAAIDRIRKSKNDPTSLGKAISLEEVANKRRWKKNIEDRDSAWHLEKKQDIERMMSYLTKEERNLLTMKEIDGMSIEEISKVLHLTETNIKVKLYRLRQKIIKAEQEQSG